LGHRRQWVRELSELSLTELLDVLKYVTTPRKRVRHDSPAADRHQLLAFAGTHFKTVHYRPHEPHRVLPSIVTTSHRDTCIVVQGPILARGNFTMATLELYRSQFPDTNIILSTWEGEIDLASRRKCDSLTIHIVTTAKPRNPGPYNVNLQKVSTRAGLVVCEAEGWPWVIRTRSDQRFHAPEAIDLLKGLWTQFPLTFDSLRLEGRIISTSLDSFRYRLYGVSDQFHFGRTSDLLNYWSLDLDERSGDFIPEPDHSMRELAELRLTETGLCAAFLESVGWEPKWTLHDYWSSLRDIFLILDSATLDLYWPKYSRREFRWKRYDDHSPLQEIDFAMWMSLYGAKETELADDLEHLLDMPIWTIPEY